MAKETIFLRSEGDIVGYGKYLLNSDTALSNESIHRIPLRSFAKRDEHLVSVYNVQIFSESEEREYHYRFNSFEDIPVVLGDLKNADKAFKQVIEWDKNKISENRGKPLPSLEETPYTVFSDIISAVKDKIQRTPIKVQFKDIVEMPRPISSQLAVDLDSESESDGEANQDTFEQSAGGPCKATDAERETHVKKELDEFDENNLPQPITIVDLVSELESDGEANMDIFEVSVDQFAAEYDSEEAKKTAVRETAAMSHGEGALRNAADLECFEKKSDELGENDVEQLTTRAKICPIRLEDPAGEKDIKSQHNRLHCTADLQRLSPAERICTKIKDKKALKNQSRKWKALKSFSRNMSRQSKAAKVILSTTDNSTVGPGGGSVIGQGESRSIAFCEAMDSSTSSDGGQDGFTINLVVPRNRAPARQGSCFPGASVESDVADHGSTTLSFSARSPMDPKMVNSSMKKRGYRSEKRNLVAKEKVSSLKSRRMKLMENSLQRNPFHTDEMFCNRECYSNVNMYYTIVQSRRFLLVDRVERKRALKSMYNAEAKQFWFNGNHVCSRFLKALSFSNQLQSVVKGTPKARGSSSIVACPRDIRQETRKNKIIIFLSNLAGLLREAIPIRDQVNLPLLSKSQVYERFLKTFSPEQIDDPLSFSYFCRVWSKNCSHIKTHCNHGLFADYARNFGLPLLSAKASRKKLPFVPRWMIITRNGCRT